MCYLSSKATERIEEAAALTIDKDTLKEYIDACRLVEETEEDIKRLRKKKKTILTDHVRGSNPEFPYQPKSFKVAGVAYTYTDAETLEHEEKILEERKAAAADCKVRVQKWMNTIPKRMQRIVRFKYIEGLSWEAVADRIGRGATKDSIRKELERFLEIS